eukprot:ANDGO_06449.mRNA.1 Twitchin
MFSYFQSAYTNWDIDFFAYYFLISGSDNAVLSLPGSSVRIIAHEVSINASVVFDLHGQNADSIYGVPSAPLPAPVGAQAAALDILNLSDNGMNQGSVGAVGSNGQNGLTGQNGGNFMIHAYNLFSFPGKQISVNLTGGVGGTGQPAQNGQQGAQGGAGYTVGNLVQNPPYPFNDAGEAQLLNNGPETCCHWSVEAYYSAIYSDWPGTAPDSCYQQLAVYGNGDDPPDTYNGLCAGPGLGGSGGSAGVSGNGGVGGNAGLLTVEAVTAQSGSLEGVVNMAGSSFAGGAAGVGGAAASGGLPGVSGDGMCTYTWAVQANIGFHFTIYPMTPDPSAGCPLGEYASSSGTNPSPGVTPVSGTDGVPGNPGSPGASSSPAFQTLSGYYNFSFNADATSSFVIAGQNLAGALSFLIPVFSQDSGNLVNPVQGQLAKQALYGFMYDVVSIGNALGRTDISTSATSILKNLQNSLDSNFNSPTQIPVLNYDSLNTNLQASLSLGQQIEAFFFSYFSQQNARSQQITSIQTALQTLQTQQQSYLSTITQFYNTQLMPTYNMSSNLYNAMLVQQNLAFQDLSAITQCLQNAQQQANVQYDLQVMANVIMMGIAIGPGVGDAAGDVSDVANMNVEDPEDNHSPFYNPDVYDNPQIGIELTNWKPDWDTRLSIANDAGSIVQPSVSSGIPVQTMRSKRQISVRDEGGTDLSAAGDALMGIMFGQAPDIMGTYNDGIGVASMSAIISVVSQAIPSFTSFKNQVRLLGSSSSVSDAINYVQQATTQGYSNQQIMVQLNSATLQSWISQISSACFSQSYQLETDFNQYVSMQLNYNQLQLVIAAYESYIMALASSYVRATQQYNALQEAAQQLYPNPSASFIATTINNSYVSAIRSYVSNLGAFVKGYQYVMLSTTMLSTISSQYTACILNTQIGTGQFFSCAPIISSTAAQAYTTWEASQFSASLQPYQQFITFVVNPSTVGASSWSSFLKNGSVSFCIDPSNPVFYPSGVYLNRIFLSTAVILLRGTSNTGAKNFLLTMNSPQGVGVLSQDPESSQINFFKFAYAGNSQLVSYTGPTPSLSSIGANLQSWISTSGVVLTAASYNTQTMTSSGAYIGVSPFTSWTISYQGSLQDLVGVSQVEFLMSIQYLDVGSPILPAPIASGFYLCPPVPQPPSPWAQPPPAPNVTASVLVGQLSYDLGIFVKSVNASWNVSATAFNITNVATGASVMSSIITASASGRSVRVSGVSVGVTYSVSVALINSFGSSPVSVMNYTVPTSRPLSPTLVTAAVVNATTLNVSWVPPTSTGGVAVLRYVLGLSRAAKLFNGTAPSPIRKWNISTCCSTVVSYPFRFAQTGASYLISLFAVNSVGSSAVAVSSNFSVPDLLPGPPANLNVAVSWLSDARSTVTVSWTPPSFIGYNSTAVSYDVLLTGSAIPPKPMIAIASSNATFTDLPFGSVYFVTVWSVNSRGRSLLSRNTTFSLPVVPPTAPKLTSVAQVSLTSLLNVTWNATAVKNGGSLLSQFWITVRLSNATANATQYVTTVVAGQAVSFVVVSIPSAWPSRFNASVNVKSVNGAGLSSPQSNSLLFEFRRPSALPDAPTDVQAARNGNRLGIYWTAPSFTGSTPILKFCVEVYSRSWSDQYSLRNGCIPAASSATSVNTTLSKPGTQMIVRVSAVNSNGTSSWSLPAYFSVPANVPSEPPFVGAFIFSAGNVTITWSKPVSDGGAPLVNYTVLWRLLSPNVSVSYSSVVVPATLTSTDVSFSSNSSYTYEVKVACSSSAGTSNYSSPIQVSSKDLGLGVDLSPSTIFALPPLSIFRAEEGVPKTLDGASIALTVKPNTFASPIRFSVLVPTVLNGAISQGVNPNTTLPTFANSSTSFTGLTLFVSATSQSSGQKVQPSVPIPFSIGISKNFSKSVANANGTFVMMFFENGTWIQTSKACPSNFSKVVTSAVDISLNLCHFTQFALFVTYPAAANATSSPQIPDVKTDTTGDSSSSNLSADEIIIIAVVCSVVFVAGVIAGICLLSRRRRSASLKLLPQSMQQCAVPEVSNPLQTAPLNPVARTRRD